MADRNRFEELAMPHLTAVYRAARALCGAAEQADDLTQATFLKAFERFETFRTGTNCKAWSISFTWLQIRTL